jgi:ankyrin repeat protein
MTSLSIGELRKRYKELREIITYRQLFESKIENQKLPYITHRTNFNFFDINGYTLLHYACMSGDVVAVTELVGNSSVKIEQVPLFVREGITPLEMALRAGHLEVAKILFDWGANCNQIVAAKVHQNCRVWFNTELLKSLNESYPELKDANFNRSNSSRFFKDFLDTPLPRLAELGDLEVIQKADAEWKYSKTLIQTVFHRAASNGHIKIVNFLLSQGAELNPKNSLFTQTALHAAAQDHQYQMAEHLISLGASINYQKEGKKTPLMLAVVSNNTEMVKLLLDNNADVMLKDVYGDCVFHYAMRQNNPDITQLLLENPKKELLLKSKNIYGLTGSDILVDRPAINHRKLLPIMHYYLTLNYRNTDYLKITGHCNGFSFLRNLYSAKKMKKYYNDTLKLFSKWDGTLQSLIKPFSPQSEQGKYHGNLMSLFESWTQDVIWFQGTATENIIAISQDEIKSKFEFVSLSDENNSIVFIWKQQSQRMTREQLDEHLFLIKKMPTGIQFNLLGGNHSTSGDVDQSNVYIDYTDPNFEFELDPEQLANFLTDIIVDVKYYAIKKINEDNTLSVSFNIYYFVSQSKDIDLDKFELFTDQELPKSKEEAESYQKKSPCQFTHLHVALLTGSIRTLEKLIKRGCCDISAKDSFGRTVFDMVIENQNAEMLSLILQFAPDKFDISKALFCSLNTVDSENNFFNIAIKYAKSVDLISLCIRQIESNNFTYVENFIHTHKKIINEFSPEGHNLLLTALRGNHFSIVEVLIKNGASALLLAKQHSPFDEDLKPISALQYVITQNRVDYFELILGNYSSQFLTLLKAHSENNIQQEIELLKDVTFKLKDRMHQSILTILLVSALQSKNTKLFIELTRKADKTLLDQLHDGKPLIVHAILEKNLPMLKALLAQGAAIDNVTDPGKNTALHVALKMNLNLDIEFIKVLLDHHANVNIKNREGVDAMQLVHATSEEIQQLIAPSQYRATFFN